MTGWCKKFGYFLLTLRNLKAFETCHPPSGREQMLLVTHPTLKSVRAYVLFGRMGAKMYVLDPIHILFTKGYLHPYM